MVILAQLRERRYLSEYLRRDALAPVGGVIDNFEGKLPPISLIKPAIDTAIGTAAHELEAVLGREAIYLDVLGLLLLLLLLRCLLRLLCPLHYFVQNKWLKKNYNF